MKLYNNDSYLRDAFGKNAIAQHKHITREIEIDEIPCELCGNPTQMLGTKRCDRCWELLKPESNTTQNLRD